jgi:peptidoglycan glycosyltransferase
MVGAACLAGQAPQWQKAVDLAAQSAAQSRIVVIDVESGQLLAGHHLREAAMTLAAPGSTLKPLVLYKLLASGRWNAANRVSCDRSLVIAGRRLACSHPQAPPFDARDALTWSCNRYFAAVAQAVKPGELGPLLHATGLLGTTGLISPEASADFREPRSVVDQELAVLGVEGIRVTPLELAEAYRWLARETSTHADTTAAQTVRAGLLDSATFGIAGEASSGDVAVAGKTGTAEGATTSRTHGWFVGLAPAEQPQVVIAVYLPSSHGADAARVAGALLAHAPLEHR